MRADLVGLSALDSRMCDDRPLPLHIKIQIDGNWTDGCGVGAANRVRRPPRRL